MRLSSPNPLLLLAILIALAASQSAVRAANVQTVFESEDPTADLVHSLRHYDGNLQLHRTPHFVLVHSMDGNWAGEMGAILEQVRLDFFQSFKSAGFSLQPTNQALPWICFSDRSDFDAYAFQTDGRNNVDWLEEYYSSRTNRVTMVRESPRRLAEAPVTPGVVLTGGLSAYHSESDSAGDNQLDLRRATHEAAHQLAFNSGIQRRGVMYPFWVAEGLATNFEAGPDGRYGLGTDNLPREEALRDAYARGDVLDLEEFVVLTRVPAPGARLNDVYAQAWGLFHFLLKEYPTELNNYLRRLAALEPGWRSESMLREEFVASLGDVSEIDREWQVFLKNLSRNAE